MGSNALESMSSHSTQDIIVEGPLLGELRGSGRGGLAGYLSAGGYDALAQAMRGGAADALARLAASGLRGRAGGGFPTAVKWKQVRDNSAAARFFVCNANTGQLGGGKESALIRLNPHAVIEAVALAASIVGAQVAFIHLGQSLEHEQQLLEAAVQEARMQKLLDPAACDIRIERSESGYLAGEETALLELLEGRPGRPRGKPAMPTRSGFQKQPTVVNNLETVLQALLAIRLGPEQFRAVGSRYASGTTIFSVVGDVARPGLYELPLGTALGSLIHEHAGGISGNGSLKAALVGGTSGTAVGAEHADLQLDYDSLAGIGGSLGSGVIIVLSDRTSMVGVARDLARFYHQNSCGKCAPCKDGTRRAYHMLDNLDRVDESATDWQLSVEPISSRKIPMLLVNAAPPKRASISYTDSGIGLEKIRLICTWYSTRGDCHHPTESSRMLQSLLDGFTDEFERERAAPAMDQDEMLSTMPAS